MKLHKVLYFSDMIHYATTGHAITGAVYRKRPFGPTCDDLLKVLRELESSGHLTVRTVDYFGYQKKAYESGADYQPVRLSHSELALMDEVIDFVCLKNTAREISELSHSRPWEMVDFGEKIPYRSAINLFPTEVSIEAMEWAAGKLQDIEAAGPKENSLGYADLAAFRSRVLEKGRAP